MSPHPRRPAAVLICCLPFLYAGIALAFFPRWTVDDAHITFRYAENLALRGELNWNVGLDPVEGYTGVFLPVWIAAGVKAGVSPFALARVTGIVSFFLTGLVLIGALRAAGARGIVAAGAGALCMTAPFMQTHATSGLETTTFTLALALVARAWLAAFGPNPKRGEALLALAALFAALVRPEGALLAILAAGFMFAARMRTGLSDGDGARPAMGFLLRFGLIFGLPGLAYFEWRVGYYGHWLPNTFYAKSAGEFDPRSLAGMGRFARDAMLLPIVAALIPLLAARSLRRVPANAAMHCASPTPESRGARPLAALLGAFLAVVFGRYLFSVPAMNFSHRFYAQFHVLLLLLLGMLAEKGWRRFELGLHSAGVDSGARSGAGVLALAPWGLGLFWAAQLAMNFALAPAEFEYAARYRRVLDAMHVPIGRFLHKHLAPEDWAAVYLDVGAVGYYSGVRILDMGALNDETLAHDRLTPERAIDYFYSNRPAALVFTTTKPDKLEYKAEVVDIPPVEVIAADPRFADYVFTDAWRPSREPLPRQSRQMVYLRSDVYRRIFPNAAKAHTE